MPIQKTYLVKIYDQDGTTLLKKFTSDRPDDSSAMCVKNAPTFATRINGAQGECVLDIKAPFDDFSEGTTIDFMNVVKIYAITIDDSVTPPTQAVTLIYTGFMSKYEPYIESG